LNAKVCTDPAASEPSTNLVKSRTVKDGGRIIIIYSLF